MGSMLVTCTSYLYSSLDPTMRSIDKVVESKDLIDTK